jgi:hypothetical protein
LESLVEEVAVKNPSTLFVICAVACWSNVIAQHPDWENFTNGQGVNVLLDHGNELWIGAFCGGLIKLDKTTGEKTFYDHANSGLPHNEVFALAIDGSNLWIGTWGGLANFDGTNWTVYDTSNSGLHDNVVSSLAIDNGNIWIGTEYDGLANFDGANWTVYNESNSPLPYDGISALAIDNSNNIWVGTGDYFGEDGGGLAKFDGANWTVYDNMMVPTGQYTIRLILICLITASHLLRWMVALYVSDLGWAG